MFIIYHSNQLEILNFLMSHHLKNHIFNDPFSSEEIIVPSTSIIPWLERSITEQIGGITANIKFILPETFIWNMFVCMLPDIPSENQFSKEKIKWKIMAIIPRMLNHPEFHIFKQYLSIITSDNHQLFILATYLSELYYQYLIYRPEWLIQWEKKPCTKIDNLIEKSQRWQVSLWHEIISFTKRLDQSISHIANIYPCFLKKIRNLKNNSNCFYLPRRIFIFNNLRLPPLYIRILEALSKHIDIHFFCVNPCRHYWGDINVNANTEETISNPILKSWGKLGRDNFYLLSQFEQTHEIDAFVDLKPDNLLHTIQHDILELEDYTSIDFTENWIKKKRLFNVNDNSIQIHISYSLQCELEVLQQQLHSLILKDPSLTPNDIIVMVPDIDFYAPFIQAIFGNTNSELYLPFHICDRSVNRIYPLVRSFISLLRIVEKNLSLDDIFSLLEIPALAMNFQISKENLADLHQILSESEKRIKADNSKNQIELFLEFNQNKLGTKLTEGIAEIYSKLSQWRELLLQPRVLDDWKPICSKMINDFFLIHNGTNPEVIAVLTFIKHKWYAILENAISCFNQDDVLPVHFLYEELLMQLNQMKVNISFMKNSINFCSLTSLRLVPFKVVCILGMNDGIYPRISSSISYNLIIHNPKIGDINQRDDDRYLFLETLLSAREIFYLSYIGSSIPGKIKKFPSLFINEILNYIVQSYYWPNDKGLELENSTNKIRNHLQHFHCKSTELENLILKNYDHNLISENFKINNMILPKQVIHELNVQNFLYFWQHPVRAFFNKRLGVKFSYPERSTINKPFILDKLTHYQIKAKLLTTLIKGDNPNDLFALYRAKGLLPDGVFTEIIWQKEQDALDKLAQTIKKYYRTSETSMPIDLSIAGIRLTGYLPHVQDNGLVRWRCTRLNFRDGLLLWLEHLVYCMMNGTGNSRMFGQKNTKWSFYALSPQEAADYLINFVEGYQRGMTSPLLLLPKTGGAWLKASYDKKKLLLSYDKRTQFKARQRLLMTWMCDKNGESHDPYLQRIFHTMDDSHITEVIKNAENWLLPIIRFNKPN
ncbi:MAG: exodeoxyribonuclease V subunit gamma [Candidatus Dasytiphilus stammeri]